MPTLELELLTGVYRAGLPDGSGPEWPPHPERVFSALVQAWGDGGRRSEERAALEWFEQLDPPEIEASGPDASWPRDAPTVFVPPNDPRGDQIEVLPERRRRQARAFRAQVPADPLIRLRWAGVTPAHHRPALEALAARVAAIGHSASLVRCRFGPDDVPLRPDRTWSPSDEGTEPLRAAYPGRLADLERWYSDDGGTKRQERPRTRRTVRYAPPRSAPPVAPAAGHLGGAPEWFVFEDAGGFRPDLLAFPHVARRVRDSLMKLGPQPSAEAVSGHARGGGPSQRPHVAIVPLASVGWEHATGDLLGFAVVLPRMLDAAERSEVLRAIGAFAGLDRGPEATAELHLTRDKTWRVRRVAAPARSSLHPERFCRPGRMWASVTPVLLDRFPDGDDPTEEARVVAAACTNIGLPEPTIVELHKHSTFTAAPSAYPGRGKPHAPSWSFPRDSKLRDRPRRHVVLRFPRAVAGPVLLGAGRYHGLGLCLPLPDEVAE